MSEIAGLIKCPVCGREEQEIRVNKNRNLYTYCETGCRLTFSSNVSRKALPVLKSGRVYAYNGYEMRPLAAENQETIINKPAGMGPAAKTEVKNNERTDVRRNSTVGRTDGQPAAAAGKPGAGEFRPSGLAAWLWGDDDAD